ncbi:MAG TPA: hypothetical protein VFW09_12505 [Solirubrobacteraceae bacterium]|nr:hypothetical protein [Solirubrobacteraceae bacterium]
MGHLLTTNKLIVTAASAVIAVGGAGAAAASAHAATTGGASIQPDTAHRIATTVPSSHHNWACPGIGFTVLHNDRSGGITLPKGSYTVSSATMSCKTASEDFTYFLDHYQGKIPGWTGHQIAPGYGTYTNNRTHQSFTVKHD